MYVVCISLSRYVMYDREREREGECVSFKAESIVCLHISVINKWLAKLKLQSLKHEKASQSASLTHFKSVFIENCYRNRCCLSSCWILYVLLPYLIICTRMSVYLYVMAFSPFFFPLLFIFSPIVIHFDLLSCSVCASNVVFPSLSFSLSLSVSFDFNWKFICVQLA